jgi:RNA polymerase sigma-70 factor (ECF subfamily)
VEQLDEAAFRAFYERTARRLWTYIYRVVGNAADADDIVQDAFCRLLMAELPALGDEDLRRYLFRIASNLITDRWRRATREQSWLERLRARGGHSEPQHDGVSQTFAALKARDRALLWLAYVEGANHQEIAASLGLAHGSVKVMLSRARARLRALLKANAIIRGR